MPHEKISRSDEHLDCVDTQVSEGGDSRSGDVCALIRKEQGREALRGLLLAGAGSAPMRCANAAYFDGLRARVRNAAQTATEN